MSEGKYRHAISHLLVAGTTIWCICRTAAGWRWVYASYGALCMYSFVGTWRYGNPRYGDDATKLYDLSHVCLMAFALPSLVTDLYLFYGFDWHYAILHTVLPIVPLTAYVLEHELEHELFDLLILGNVISLTVLSTLQDNYFGIAAAFSYALNHFLLKNQDISEVPRKVFYNVGLCFYVFYGFRALFDAQLLPLY